MRSHRVIDVDGHVFEDDHIWEEHLAPEYWDRRPRLVRDERGTTRYAFQGAVFPKGHGVGAWVPEGIREASVHRDGAVDAKARLEDMDTDGIDVAVLYGAMGLSLHITDDEDLAIAVCRAYNDWLFDYCAADPDRLKGTPALPLKHVGAAVDEARRAVTELGFVSLTMPCAVGTRNPDDHANDPIYALAEELDVPLGLHAGGLRLVHDRFTDSYAQLHTLDFPFTNMFAATKVVCGGVLERFKTLRIALLESGVGWVPYMFERFDEHYEHRTAEFTEITKPPSEYLAEGRLFVSTEGEHGLPQVIAQAGSHWIVWASDYPHWDAEFPGAVAKVADDDAIDAADRAAILDGNARRLFGWD
jgi:predicted TIM-barrel fold metal-dependent hydrolase